MDDHAEVERLRAELEKYRQRELDDMRHRLAEAESLVVHYRDEANRNANTGRQIASEYERQVTELKAKIAVYERIDSSVRRTGK